jgi:hypothetical protein
MKLRKLKELGKEAVGKGTTPERVTAISPEDLKSVVGGVTVMAEAHAHYSYNSSCSSSCGSAEF